MDVITQQLKLKDIFPDAVVGEYADKYGLGKDDVDFIRKGYTTSGVEFTSGEKGVISYVNTAAIDRDAEVVLPEGGIMGDYRNHPVVMFGHDYSELPVGKNEWLKLDDKGWKGKTVYANTKRANEIYEYRKAGFPLAESIGFIPLEITQPGDGDFDDLAKALARRGAFKRSDIPKIRRIYKKWLMLEYSDVPIPSNPEALEIAIEKGLVPKPEEMEEEKQPKTMSQSEIKDELDYILIICQEHTLNEDNQALAKQLISELMRLSGGDTPVEIEESEEEVESLNNEEFREFLTEEIKRQIGGKLNA